MGKPRIGAIGLAGMSVFLQVDHFHLPGETVHASHLYSEIGGKAVNQAVAAKRMGVDASFFGAVGDDETGRLCYSFLTQEGLTPCLETHPGIPSAYACILTDKQGENRVSVFSGAAAHLSEDFIRSQETALCACDMLLLGLECPWEATLAALEIALSNAIPVVLNPKPTKNVPLEWLKKCCLLTPNAQEAATLLGISQESTPIQFCEALKRQNFPVTVVTLGSRGALLWDRQTGTLFDAPAVTAADTTGAGDCFNGALAASVCQGLPLDAAVEVAVYASSLSVQTRYVMPSLPSLSPEKPDPHIIRHLVWQSAY